MNPPEFCRPVAVRQIGAEGLAVTVEASVAERAALAKRMAVAAIPALSCRFDLRRGAAGAIEAAGQLHGQVVQTCVVSLDEFDAPVAEAFVVRFVPAGSETKDDDPEAIDEIPFEGDSIDLGEAAAEQFALALDPYPRRPGALLPDLGANALDPRLAALARWRGDAG